MRANDQVSILVVAEAPEKALGIEAILEELGQKVVCAHSGRDALRCMLKSEFAVIVLDAEMEEMNGFETAARIRKRRRSEHTPIIFVTPCGEDGEYVADRSLGAVDCVSTPVDPQKLRSKVEVFIDLYQNTEVIRQQAAHRVQLAREQAARQTAEKAMRRSALLAEASRVLSRSLDFDDTLQSLHRAVVPALADACQLVLYDPDGDLWFAPLGAQELSWPPAGQGSHARIQHVGAQLGQSVRDAIETGHAQTIAAEALSGEAGLPCKTSWASVVIAPLVARDNPLGAIVCCRHSPRRQFEPPDVALIEDLAGRAATALDNAQLYQTIREGERRKDEFLAMLGHELRNPLAAITNASELTKLLSPTDSAFHETLEIIRQQVSLMKRLVDDLLDVSRITSGRVQLQRSIVSAGEVVARVAEAASPLFTSRNHALHLSVPDEEIQLEADPYRLEQILSNLMVNAAKYTDPGGKIHFSVALEGKDVVFRVKDTGMGIGPDLLPNVFDLFSQANRSLHRAEGGLGIGLTIVKGLTELHGGRVSAHSDGISRGSEFVVCLPAAVGEVENRPASPSDAATATAQPRRVLVVEDQPALLHVTVALLKKLGHDVRAAADGAEALLAVKEYRPDVVFLDIGLPGMDGYEVANSLRAELGDAVPMLVAMTGYGEHEVKRHAQKARFDHHLVKPADVDAMQALLSQAD